MLNKCRRGIVAGLVALMLFVPSGAAFAETADGSGSEDFQTIQKKDAIKEDVADVQLKAATSKAVKAQTPQEITKKSTATGNILTTITSSSQKMQAVGVAFNQNDFISNYDSHGYGKRIGYRQAVTLPAKGTVAISTANMAGNKGVSVGLYKDAGLTTEVEAGSYAYIYPNDSTSEVRSTVIQVPAAGTYYIGISCVVYGSESFTQQVAVAAGYINGGDRTIKNGQTVLVGAQDAQTTYFKFKAPKTGSLRLATSAPSTTQITLCKSNKGALSKRQYIYNGNTFAVKGGRTYYIKVNTGYLSNGNYAFQVKNSAIKEKSGTKRSKAKTIKRNKTKKGTIIAGSKTADWYKFKLSSKRNMKITMKGGTNDKLKIAVYNSKGKRIGNAKTFNHYNGTLTLKSIGKFKKGTYYIKVYRGNKYSSGWYSLKWK